ncbi:MAG: radical SAM protein [Thermodesulfobacteriota bacterium]
MMLNRTDQQDMTYRGFEQGPIRPPSEAYSLLVRVTRNCPWNRCTFCPVYKGAAFSVRPLAHVLLDLDAIYEAVQKLRQQGPGPAAITGDRGAWMAARNWVRNGCRQVFLQDANSLVVPPAHLKTILQHLKVRFPEVTRVTSYARSNSIANLDAGDLAGQREAGLNRIHIGMESGADPVLKMVHKGTTKRMHILAGRKVKDAGMELSEYYMPGLGGRRCLEINALETAAALNAINPDFIRLRTLAIPPGTPLFDDYDAGRFDKATDLEMARELLLFLEALTGITSTVRSDHILNLLPEVDGQLPQDRERLIGVVRAFLSLDPELQFLYRVGRRTGFLSGLRDLDDIDKISQVEAICQRYNITSDTVDAVTDEMMRRFI